MHDGLVFIFIVITLALAIIAIRLIIICYKKPPKSPRENEDAKDFSKLKIEKTINNSRTKKEKEIRDLQEFVYLTSGGMCTAEALSEKEKFDFLLSEKVEYLYGFYRLFDEETESTIAWEKSGTQRRILIDVDKYNLYFFEGDGELKSTINIRGKTVPEIEKYFKEIANLH